jgi:hypothetical protein
LVREHVVADGRTKPERRQLPPVGQVSYGAVGLVEIDDLPAVGEPSVRLLDRASSLTWMATLSRSSSRTCGPRMVKISKRVSGGDTPHYM